MEKIYAWFLEPLDKHTNDIISSELGEEDFQRHIACADGTRRDLWRCENHRLISKLKTSKSQFNLKFNIFVREGGGKIRRFGL